VFVQPTDDVASTTVHARFGPWSGSEISPGQPTLTKGVAVRMGSSTIEVLAGSPPVVLVDGVVATVPDGETVTIADGLYVARSGGRYLIETPDVNVTVAAGDYLDVLVSTETGVPVAGLLGSPDDDLVNDLRTRAGATVSLTGVREHGPDLYELTDSWRVTTVADSLFTEQDEFFARPNALYNSASLEPFRARARTLLASIGTSCDTDSAASAYAVDALAIELSIGTPVDQLGNFTCSYTVQGRLTSGPDETPLEAVSIVLDGVGLGRCEATTTVSGTYECILPMNLAEITGAGLTEPPVVTYRAAFAESPTELIASGPVATGGLPPLNGTAMIRNDVDVDIAFLPSLVVSGRFTGVGGLPYSGPAGVFMYLYGENGRALGHLFTRVAIDSLDGSYEVLRALPRDVRAVNVQISMDNAPAYDWRQFWVEDVVRERREITYDLEVRPPSLAISGSLLVNGSPTFSTGSSYGLLVESRRADGSSLPTLNQSFGFDRVTGAISGDIVLPDDAVEAVVVFRHQWGAFFGQHDEVRVPVAALAPDERRAVVLAIDHQATTYDLAGAVSIDGVASTGQVSIFANYFDPEGRPIGTQPSFNTALVGGRFTVTGLRAPERAALARVSIGQVGSGVLSETRDLSLTPGDHTSLTFDLHQATTRFIVRGTTNCAGEPDLSDGGPRIHLFDGDTYLGQLDPVYVVGPDGRFETSVRLPVAVDRVVLYVDRCVFTFPGDQQVSVDIVPSQENVYEVDMVTSMLRMRGALVGTPEQLEDIDLWMTVEERDVDGEFVDEQRYGTFVLREYDELDRLVGATYERDVNLRPETDSVVVRFVDGRTDQVYSTVTYTGLVAGDHQYVHDVDLRQVTLPDWPISGVLMEGAGPLAGVELTVTADGFVLDPDAATYQFRSTSSRTVTTDATGRWAVDTGMADTADLARVTVRLSNGQQWQRSFGVTPGAPAPYTFDIDHAARHLGYSGNVLLDGCPAPNTFEREVWTAASAPVGPYDWESGTWPGATLAGRFLVVPDLTAPYDHQITAEIPRDAAWIGTVYRARNTSGTGQFEVPANVDIGLRGDETAACDR
jgi:hypothetical protein